LAKKKAAIFVKIHFSYNFGLFYTISVFFTRLKQIVGLAKIPSYLRRGISFFGAKKEAKKSQGRDVFYSGELTQLSE
jgi:NADH:ubiquinone oxidoreductase subunit F (NADH-binding)